MQETIFYQKSEDFSSNFQITCRAKISAFGRFLHFSQKGLGVTLSLLSCLCVSLSRKKNVKFYHLDTAKLDINNRNPVRKEEK